MELFGVVVIGVVVLVMGLLVYVVVGLKQVYKGLDVKFIIGKLGELVEQVEVGELDGVLVVEYLECLLVNFVWYLFYIELLVVVVGCYMCGCVEEVLCIYLFLCFDCVVCMGVFIDWALCKMYMVVNEFIEVNLIEVIIELVCQQVGVMLVLCLCCVSWESDFVLCVLFMLLQMLVCVVGMIEWKEYVWYGVIQVVFDVFEIIFGNFSVQIGCIQIGFGDCDGCNYLMLV